MISKICKFDWDRSTWMSMPTESSDLLRTSGKCSQAQGTSSPVCVLCALFTQKLCVSLKEPNDIAINVKESAQSCQWKHLISCYWCQSARVSALVLGDCLLMQSSLVAGTQRHFDECWRNSLEAASRNRSAAIDAKAQEPALVLRVIYELHVQSLLWRIRFIPCIHCSPYALHTWMQSWSKINTIDQHGASRSCNWHFMEMSFWEL